MPDVTPRPFSLLTATRRLTARHDVAIRVSCPATEDEGCRGGLVAEVDDAVSMRLGAARFSLRSGQSETVRVRFARRGVRLLARLRWLPVYVRATGVDAADNELTVEAHFRVLAARKVHTSNRRASRLASRRGRGEKSG